MRRHYCLVALALAAAAAPLAMAQQQTRGSLSNNPLGRSALDTGFPSVLSTPLGAPSASSAPPGPSALVHVATVTPVPEPSEWLLMLTGLGVVGAIARRRARRP